MEYTSILKSNGWAFIPGNNYFKNFAIECKNSLENWQDALTTAYASLEEDSYSPGNRHRSYIQFQHVNNKIIFGIFYHYSQTKEYNSDTGGIIRKYPKIHSDLLSNPLFYSIIESDIKFATSYNRIDDLNNLEMGIHLFRYQAKIDKPSFSSPLWLHKDDEDLVFVHHIKTSANALGGENLIAPNGKQIEKVLRLTGLLDTLVVDHQKFHAVTPLGSADSELVTRDVILVTFQNKKVNHEY